MPSLRPTANETPTDEQYEPPDTRFEAVHVRNYDVADTHTVSVAVTAPDGDRVFSRRYHLRPGQADSEQGVLPPGTYDVVVHADGLDRVAKRVELGPQPEGTALVELGNGITSVSQGVY